MLKAVYLYDILNTFLIFRLWTSENTKIYRIKIMPENFKYVKKSNWPFVYKQGCLHPEFICQSANSHTFFYFYCS